jgi:hypothetical protein
MSDADAWSSDAWAEEILRRLAAHPEHYARYLQAEREYLRSYRRDHPHDLGPLPGAAQCLTAFRNKAVERNLGNGYSEMIRKFRERNPPPRLGFLTYDTPRPERPPIPEDEWMSTYRLLAEIEAAMDEERIMARQAPAEDTPLAPLGLASDADADPPPSEPPRGVRVGEETRWLDDLAAHFRHQGLADDAIYSRLVDALWRRDACTADGTERKLDSVEKIQLRDTCAKRARRTIKRLNRAEQ